MKYVRLTLTLPQAKCLVDSLLACQAERSTPRRAGLLSMVRKEIAQQTDHPAAPGGKP